MPPCFNRLALLIITALLLVGCASTPSISLEKDKTGPIATVALLRVTESQQFIVRNLSKLPVLGGGAIGGTIAGVVEAKRTETFVDEYNRRSVQLSASLVGNLQRELNSSGMQISYFPDEFAKLKDGADDYSHIKTDKDAILSIWFGPVGYIAKGAIADAPYEPWVVVHVRLLQSKTMQVLSQTTYTAGYKAKQA